MTPEKTVPAGFFGKPPRRVRVVRVERITRERPDANGIVYDRADCVTDSGEVLVIRSGPFGDPLPPMGGQFRIVVAPPRSGRRGKAKTASSHDEELVGVLADL